MHGLFSFKLFFYVRQFILYCLINFQLIDNDCIFRNLRICPGSNSDKHIWNHSEAKQFFEHLRRTPEILEQEGRYYVLGKLLKC